MKLKIITLVCLVAVVLTLILSGNPFDPREAGREKLISHIIQTGLERWHYSGKKIDDDFSQKAFTEFMDYLDYGKRFFLAEDVRELQKYSDKLDDQFIAGTTEMKEATTQLLEKRIKQVMEFYPKILDKPFDFSISETIEFEQKKLNFCTNMDELKEYWRKILKYSTLERYIALSESELKKKQDLDKKITANKENVDKKADEKGDETSVDESDEDDIVSSGPINTDKVDAELEAKARKAVLKSFKSYLDRMLQGAQNDALSRYINALVQIYDPHTNYFPPIDKNTFDMQMSGRLEGIGAQLQQEEEYVKIHSIVPGGPSWRQGQLKAGDLILKVGQGEDEALDIIGMRVQDAVKIIRGKKGTLVKLTVKKPDGNQMEIPIIRDVVILEETFAKSAVLVHKKSGKRYGYIYLPGFYNDFSHEDGRTSSNDVKAELEVLKELNVAGVILDIRNNGGGALQDAVDMSGLFIPQGPIVQVKNKQGVVKVLEDTDPKVTFDGPLIVLVNRLSASASEILSAALQDYKRAVIVGGAHTFGKGTVQAMVNLDSFVADHSGKEKSLGALTITIQKFYRINGTSIQLRGVTPDIVLPDRHDSMEIGEEHLDYYLDWDSVDSASFQKWPPPADYRQLQANSSVRVTNKDAFKVVENYVEKVTELRKVTSQSLELKEAVARREMLRLERKKLNDAEIDSPQFSVLPSAKPEKQESGKLEELAKERQKSWFKAIKKDLILGEALEIMADMSGTTGS